jgi:hypothetical protein
MYRPGSLAALVPKGERQSTADLLAHHPVAVQLAPETHQPLSPVMYRCVQRFFSKKKLL